VRVSTASRRHAPRAADLGAATLVAAVAAALAWTEFADGDLGVHLATGREVLQSGRIPATNVLSFTHPEQPWDLHQWLPGVLFELIQRAQGLLGLQLLRAALVSATWLAVFAAARLLGASALAAALGTVLGAAASAFRFELRPYLFTHLALAATLAFAAGFLRARARDDVRAARRALVGAALVPVAACHFHAGVVDSWLLMLALAAGTALEPLRARLLPSPPQPPAGLRAAAAPALALGASVVLAALSLALYHPIGARILLFPFAMGSNAYLAEHLVEFRPPWRFPVAMLLPYWALLALAFALAAAQARRLHLFWAIALAGFALLSLKHVRLCFGFAIVAAPIVAAGIGPWLARARGLLRAALLVAVIAGALLHRGERARFGVGLAQWTFPPLFDYVQRHDLAGEAFVSDAWAGPWLGRFYPRRRAFFDNRLEAYPPEFVRDVYQRIRYGRPGWDTLLDRHRVEVVLLRYTTPGEARLQGGAPNLRQRIVRDPRWTLVTFDDDGMLCVRTAGSNAAHARAFALPFVDPDGLRFLAAPRTAAVALRREIERGNRSARVRLFAALAALDAGDGASVQPWLEQAAGAPDAAAMFRQLQRNSPGVARP
jgi:hypothetical protein